MNEKELARRAARAERDRKEAIVLADLDITPSEASLFNVVHYGLTLRPPDLCQRATFRDYSLGGPVTAEMNEVALTSCLEKDWLQLIDDAALRHIHDDVSRHQLLGPIYGYPSIGGVDFTLAGAEQWFRICNRLWNGGSRRSYAYCDVVRKKTSHFYSSKSKADAERNRFKDSENVVSVSAPIPIGPWRANWWRRFPEGYRIDVEQRMQWQGRCASGGGSIYFYLMNLPVDYSHASEVLDRHNVTWTEWLVLLTVENAERRSRIVHDVAQMSKRFGNSLTEADCHRGLEACLRNGWLCQVDQDLKRQVAEFVRSDSAVMPFPFDPANYRAEIDFSTEGALFYRMISAEILGQTWEESVRVEETTYWEEHRYCLTEAGFDEAIREHEATGEFASSVRTVPIGPWCVYWWERFNSGYRSEWTFGEL